VLAIIDREYARDYLTRTARHHREAEARGVFATFPRDSVYLHCEHVLRWLDCAPEGARFQLAPMQDKTGAPCGTVFDENIGAGKALRNARARRGLHPLTGKREQVTA
jgi:hypothetical protein